MSDETWHTQGCPDDAPNGACWDCGAGKRELHRPTCQTRCDCGAEPGRHHREDCATRCGGLVYHVLIECWSCGFMWFTVVKRPGAEIVECPQCEKENGT